MRGPRLAEAGCARARSSRGSDGMSRLWAGGPLAGRASSGCGCSRGLSVNSVLTTRSRAGFGSRGFAGTTSLSSVGSTTRRSDSSVSSEFTNEERKQGLREDCGQQVAAFQDHGSPETESFSTMTFVSHEEARDIRGGGGEERRSLVQVPGGGTRAKEVGPSSGPVANHANFTRVVEQRVPLLLRQRWLLYRVSAKDSIPVGATISPASRTVAFLPRGKVIPVFDAALAARFCCQDTCVPRPSSGGTYTPCCSCASCDPCLVDETPFLDKRRCHSAARSYAPLRTAYLSQPSLATVIHRDKSPGRFVRGSCSRTLKRGWRSVSLRSVGDSERGGCVACKGIETESGSAEGRQWTRRRFMSVVGKGKPGSEAPLQFVIDSSGCTVSVTTGREQPEPSADRWSNTDGSSRGCSNRGRGPACIVLHSGCEDIPTPSRPPAVEVLKRTQCPCGERPGAGPKRGTTSGWAALGCRCCSCTSCRLIVVRLRTTEGWVDLCRIGGDGKLGEMQLEKVDEAEESFRTPQLYQVIADGYLLNVRPGLEIEGPVARTLPPATHVEVFERRLNKEGLMRLRLADGWISERRRGGETSSHNTGGQQPIVKGSMFASRVPLTGTVAAGGGSTSGGSLFAVRVRDSRRLKQKLQLLAALSTLPASTTSAQAKVIDRFIASLPSLSVLDAVRTVGTSAAFGRQEYFFGLACDCRAGATTACGPCTSHAVTALALHGSAGLLDSETPTTSRNARNQTYCNKRREEVACASGCFASGCVAETPSAQARCFGGDGSFQESRYHLSGENDTVQSRRDVAFDMPGDTRDCADHGGQQQQSVKGDFRCTEVETRRTSQLGESESARCGEPAVQHQSCRGATALPRDVRHTFCAPCGLNCASRILAGGLSAAVDDVIAYVRLCPRSPAAFKPCATPLSSPKELSGGSTDLCQATHHPRQCQAVPTCAAEVPGTPASCAPGLDGSGVPRPHLAEDCWPSSYGCPAGLKTHEHLRGRPVGGKRLGGQEGEGDECLRGCPLGGRRLGGQQGDGASRKKWGSEKSRADSRDGSVFSDFDDAVRRQVLDKWGEREVVKDCHESLGRRSRSTSAVFSSRLVRPSRRNESDRVPGGCSKTRDTAGHSELRSPGSARNFGKQTRCSGTPPLRREWRRWSIEDRGATPRFSPPHHGTCGGVEGQSQPLSHDQVHGQSPRTADGDDTGVACSFSRGRSSASWSTQRSSGGDAGLGSSSFAQALSLLFSPLSFAGTPVRGTTESSSSRSISSGSRPAENRAVAPGDTLMNKGTLPSPGDGHVDAVDAAPRLRSALSDIGKQCETSHVIPSGSRRVASTLVPSASTTSAHVQDLHGGTEVRKWGHISGEFAGVAADLHRLSSAGSFSQAAPTQDVALCCESLACRGTQQARRTLEHGRWDSASSGSLTEEETCSERSSCIGRCWQVDRRFSHPLHGPGARCFSFVPRTVREAENLRSDVSLAAALPGRVCRSCAAHGAILSSASSPECSGDACIVACEDESSSGVARLSVVGVERAVDSRSPGEMLRVGCATKRDRSICHSECGLFRNEEGGSVRRGDHGGLPALLGLEGSESKSTGGAVYARSCRGEPDADWCAGGKRSSDSFGDVTGENSDGPTIGKTEDYRRNVKGDFDKTAPRTRGWLDGSPASPGIMPFVTVAAVVCCCDVASTSTHFGTPGCLRRDSRPCLECGGFPEFSCEPAQQPCAREQSPADASSVWWTSCGERFARSNFAAPREGGRLRGCDVNSRRAESGYGAYPDCEGCGSSSAVAGLTSLASYVPETCPSCRRHSVDRAVFLGRGAAAAVRLLTEIASALPHYPRHGHFLAEQQLMMLERQELLKQQTCAGAEADLGRAKCRQGSVGSCEPAAGSTLASFPAECRAHSWEARVGTDAARLSGSERPLAMSLGVYREVLRPGDSHYNFCLVALLSSLSCHRDASWSFPNGVNTPVAAASAANHGPLPSCGSGSRKSVTLNKCSAFTFHPPPVFRVRKIERLHNPLLLQRYVHERETMLLFKGNRDCESVENILGNPILRVQPDHPGMAWLNEFFLFHGCKGDRAQLIALSGFDFRRAGENRGKLFGTGTYFSPLASKADLYTRTLPDAPGQSAASANAPTSPQRRWSPRATPLACGSGMSSGGQAPDTVFRRCRSGGSAARSGSPGGGRMSRQNQRTTRGSDVPGVSGTASACRSPPDNIGSHGVRAAPSSSRWAGRGSAKRSDSSGPRWKGAFTAQQTSSRDVSDDEECGKLHEYRTSEEDNSTDEEPGHRVETEPNPKTAVRTLILSRVCLGDVYRATRAMPEARMPPAMAGPVPGEVPVHSPLAGRMAASTGGVVRGSGTPPATGAAKPAAVSVGMTSGHGNQDAQLMHYDSIMAESRTKGGVVDSVEFVVFERGQALPLYCITYTHDPACRCAFCYRFDS
ncbi:poly(adp-ribose) polymerase catalytic domain protein [Cystoisospora suis]|uniref:Poly(Adp-ribose) polymerase catalytic domain protein n=1 Tax=Cystoisospora suis TaxID=483139 RepID=A0A2C6LG90_9APIC|nr:poly(adp-ribose) polymerase catalytic domain protein [Cystoisospora suis]